MKKVSEVFPKPVHAPARHALARPPRARRSKPNLARDQGGAVAVMLALMLAALLGMLGLAMDLGKVWNLETQLQHAADAGALAGVTQLDGTDGARVRAIRAVVSELANNTQIFAQDNVDADSSGTPDGLDIDFDTTETIDGGGISVNRDIKFYTILPTDPANESTSDEDARFIEVNVWPRTTEFAFAALVGAPSSASPGARAVAGWESLYCDSPVMMMCNPGELDWTGSGPAQFDFYSSCPDDGDGTSCVGRGITMKARAGAPEPGDFGYLSLTVIAPDGSVTTVSGANNLKDALASVEYASVCTGNQVTTEPGNMASLDQFINQRFDIYPDQATALLPNRQPAANVGRGLLKKATFDALNGKCKFAPQTPASPGDWARPEDPAGPTYRGYIGPGMHVRDMVPLVAPFTTETDNNGDDIYVYNTFVDNSDGFRVLEADNTMGEMTPPIWAMAYPKDTCNYTYGAGGDSDEATYEADPDNPALPHPEHPVLLAGAGGCLFKTPNPNPSGSLEVDRQIGTGQWDIQIYLDVYHPGMIEDDLIDPCGDPDHPMCADAPNSLDPVIPRDGKISRWEMYNWEKRYDVATNAYPNMAYAEEPLCYNPTQDFLGSNYPSPQAGEYSLPQAPAGANTPDRRILVMAVVNCDAMGGGKKTVDRTQPDSNVAVFLHEPMGYTMPDTLFGELVDPNGLGIGSVDTNPTMIRERIVLIE